MARLEDFCSVASSSIKQSDLDSNDGKYPIYGASGLIKYVDFYIQDKPYIGIVKDGAGIGRVMCLPPYSSVIGTMQYIIPKENVNVEYLAYAMEYMNLSKYYSGATIPHIYFRDYKNEPMPNYAIKDQERIAHIIKKVDELSSLRKKQLQKLDNLVKARFVEMTQNSTTTPIRMGDVATYVNGFAFKPTDWTNEGLPIIRIQNLNDKDAPYNHYAGAIDSKYRVHTGDILVSWATHLEAYVWQGGDAWLNQHIFRVIFDKMPINKIYFVYSTEEALRQAFRNAHGFKPTMEHIKRSDFEDAIIALPAIEIQEEFAAFVSQVDKSKLFIRKSLEKLETLKQSLMQQYFG